MELRKDPITRSWVAVGHAEEAALAREPCPFCPGQEGFSQTLLELPVSGPWQVRVIPHFDPLYRIESDPGRSADGMYDRMRPVGAHEIVIETRDHNRPLAFMTDEEILLVLSALALRVTDLKKDMRFKYVTVFKNSGALAGQEWPHSHSQITATTFVPRRVLYELRSAREWFRQRERCVFCDILRQEERQGKRIVDLQEDFVAFCPYASRVPFETWLMCRTHNHRFEAQLPGTNRRHLAALLGRVLRRLSRVSEAYHLVLHTSPSESQTRGELSGYWHSIANDYHWHIEILPIIQTGRKSYGIKEVYFNPLMPEAAAETLRATDAGG
jgi:UDPglucose--hexose-1-phosphate uridylyltransferase